MIGCSGVPSRTKPTNMSDSPFSPRQLEELAAPLSQAVVKTREQSGRTLHYIEGWWAIQEANRIFGFGAWDQEILNVKCVSERERTVGRTAKKGWGVSYIISIRVTVNGVKREGVGAGHGIDVDLGIAHESAVKEAATDGLKRALMTFGNQFGLALYDKEQRNVDNAPARTEPVSEAEQITQRFLDTLFGKMELVGLDRHGIKTLKTILDVVDFGHVPEELRGKLIAKLTPEYAARLNNGQNSKGDQVIEPPKPPEEPATGSVPALGEAATPGASEQQAPQLAEEQK